MNRSSKPPELLFVVIHAAADDAAAPYRLSQVLELSQVRSLALLKLQILASLSPQNRFPPSTIIGCQGSNLHLCALHALNSESQSP